MAKPQIFLRFLLLIIFSVAMLFMVNSLLPLHQQEIRPVDGCATFWLPECGCRQKVCRSKDTAASSSSSPYAESLCSEAASFLGEGQKVISYTFFLEDWNRSDTTRGHSMNYLKGLGFRLNETRELYPGWVLRLYSDLPSPLEKNSSLCTLRCGSSSSDFFYCNVSSLPGELRNLVSSSYGMSWRFVPLADPTVETFLSRDLDSRLSPREVAAVRVWENSTKTFHFIRDGYWHDIPILGGLWGAKTSKLGLSERQEILQQLLHNSPANGTYGVDQDALSKVLYTPKYHNASLAHDRVFCRRYSATLCIRLPHPRRAERDNYIGIQELSVRLGLL